MSQLYILYEHASGFAIFRTTEFEEVAAFLPQVRESILNISKFRSNVFFVTFQAFQDKKDALCNMQDITSGKLSTDLQLFVENNIPRSKSSKQPVVLGVGDPELAAEISEKLGIKCISSGLVLEVIRGVRFHFYKLVKGFKDENSGSKAQLSLAHNYSREKLKFDATRQDCMIIESNNLIDELEKDINTLGKGIKKSYAFHFPELFKIIPDNTELYVQCIDAIGDRKHMPENIEERLNSILEDSHQVETVLIAAHNSMGTDVSSFDVENLKMLCRRVMSLIKQRKSTVEYLKRKINHIAPNLSSLVGEMIASSLISRAGGLEKLAKLTSSTIQVLGAQKKFFRTLKDRKEKAPICGLLSNSAFMGKAGKKKKGRLARMLASKCSLAARVDCFSKKRTEEYGSQLVKEVEENIKYVKNIKIKADVNKEALEEIDSAKKNFPSKKAKKLHKIGNALDIEIDDDLLVGSTSKDNSLKLNEIENVETEIEPSNNIMSICKENGKVVDKDSRYNLCTEGNFFELSNVETSNVDTEELPESVTDTNVITNLRKKRKSKSAKPVPNTKDKDEETSEILVDDDEDKKPPRKRCKTRLRKKE